MRLLILNIYLTLTSCAGTFRSVNEKDPVESCLADARAEMLIYGSPDRAWAYYIECRDLKRESP